MITGKLYDYLKWTAQVVLPALGTLYVALAALWSLPEAHAVAGTVLAVDTFLGVLLGISQVSYNRQVSTGTMHVNPDGESLRYSLVVDDPESLRHKKEVRFRVIKAAVTSNVG